MLQRTLPAGFIAPCLPTKTDKLPSSGQWLDEIKHDGFRVLFAHACKLALEGIVSKRKNSAYRSGRSPDWLKMKNSDAPAVKRERRKNGADEPSQVRDRWALHERDFPHLVELVLPRRSFRNKSQEFESFHRERGIVIRRGCGRHEGEQC